MTTEQPEGANWGDPAPTEAAQARKPWSGKKTAIAAGIAVVIAAGGGVAIWAGTSAGTTAAQQGGPGGFGGPGGQFGGPGGFGGGMAALREALHGDFVVTDANGGYTTERLQTGDVTELSATSRDLARPVAAASAGHRRPGRPTQRRPLLGPAHPVARLDKAPQCGIGCI